MWWLPEIERTLYLNGQNFLLRGRARKGWRKVWRDLEQGPRAELPAALARHSAQRTLALQIWLGGSQCRYLAFPRSAGVRTLKHLETIAMKAFTDQSGLDMKDWIVALHAQPAAVVACALRQALLSELREAAQAAKFNIVQLRPWVGHAARELAVHTPSANVLALLEEDAVTLLDERGPVPRIVSMPATADNRAAPIARLTTQLGLDAQQLPVYDATHASPTVRCRQDFIDRLTRQATANNP